MSCPCCGSSSVWSVPVLESLVESVVLGVADDVPVWVVEEISGGVAAAVFRFGADVSAPVGSVSRRVLHTLSLFGEGLRLRDLSTDARDRAEVVEVLESLEAAKFLSRSAGVYSITAAGRAVLERRGAAA